MEKDSEVSIVEEEKNDNAKEEKNDSAEEDQKQQDADIYIDVDKDKDKDIDKDTADVGSTDGADLGNKAESDNNADIDNEANSQNGTDSEYSNPSEDHTSDSSAEAGGSSGSEVSADSSSDSGSEDGGQSTENSNDAGSTDTGHPMASISIHPVYRVTDTGIATPSKATDSDADEDLLDGTLYNAVRLENAGAVAFVVDAAELGLDDPALEKLASPSDADYAFTASLGDVIVHVFADQGVLPEDAELRVTELREDDSETAEKFQEAKDALDAENTEYSGMMALDISFYDEDGNEIEPDGDVQVSIEMNTAMLPGDVNPESVAVQHLAETTDGIQVQTVADSTDEVDGTVEVTEEGEVVTAEFGVKSFSTFTITWQGSGRTYFKITASYKGIDGSDLQGKTTKTITLSYGDEIVFDDYANDVDGYTYVQTILHKGNKDYEVVRAAAETENGGQIVRFYDEAGGFYTYRYSNSTVNINVDLIYQKKNALSGTIEAKVYLRYSNEIPTTINGNDTAAGYGPSGNNVPYITVTVDLDEVNRRSVYAEKYSSGAIWYYYSIESDSASYPEHTKDSAVSYWNDVIYPAIEENDRADLDNIFGGEGKYVGYVLKKENDGWHIDGVLAETPPNYVVELYDHSVSGMPCLFAISDNNKTLPGVSYENFKKKLETELGGTNYEYTTEKYDLIVVKYQKDGYTYQITITPREENSHIDYTGEKFGYRTMTQDLYYLCQLKMETEKVSGDLVISKEVAGSAKNADEHFKFTLTGSGVDGTYELVYAGNDESCNAEHTDSVQFVNGSAVVYLKDGESVSIRNLPADQAIAITETPGAYTSAVDVTVDGAAEENGVEVTIKGSTTTVHFKNTQTISTPTGILMDNRPYLLMLALAALGLSGIGFSGYTRKKRRDQK